MVLLWLALFYLVLLLKHSHEYCRKKAEKKHYSRKSFLYLFDYFLVSIPEFLYFIFIFLKWKRLYSLKFRFQLFNDTRIKGLLVLFLTHKVTKTTDIKLVFNSRVKLDWLEFELILIKSSPTLNKPNRE